MITDPIVFALSVAFGLALGWAITHMLWRASYGWRRFWRKVGCKCGIHAPSGRYVPAVGGRDVMRCDYCDCIVYEVERTKNSLRRVK